MTNIFPKRNLPSRAEQWGRAIEGEIVSIEKEITQEVQREENWGRASSGRLSVLSRNLDEIAERSSESFQLESLSVSGSATSEPFPRVNKVVSFSPTSGRRNALITLTGNVSETPQTGARLYVYLLHQGNVIGATQIQPVFMFSTPNEWANNAPARLVSVLTTSSGQPTDITVRLVRGTDPTIPGSSTLTLKDPIITLTKSGAL